MKRIEIMRAVPTVVNGQQFTKIVGRSNELFRLLVLNKGTTVCMDAIGGLRNTNADTANSKVRYLRNQLKAIGCESLVESDRSTGYRAVLDGWQVDSMEFESLVGHQPCSLTHLMLHPINRDATQTEIIDLNKALAIWHDNPALTLSGEHHNHHAHFERLKRKAQDRLLMARLYSHDYSEIREAIQELLGRTRNAADDIVWELLLLAHHAIGSPITSVTDEIAKHYRRAGTPPRLTELIFTIKNGTFSDNQFRNNGAAGNDSHVSDRENNEEQCDQMVLRELCSTLGITTASRLRLTDSRLTPLDCIHRTRTRLDFSGVLASKWVTEPVVRHEFSRLLTRLDRESGEVRFLIINPKGDGFERLRELRNGGLSAEPLTPLILLANRHKSLSVRLYDALPAFRIVAIDDDVLSFSPYRLGAEAYLSTDRGWKAPHIVLDPLADYPLAEAFRLLFMETWLKATPLEDMK